MPVLHTYVWLARTVYTYTLYMTVNLVIFLQIIPYIHRMYIYTYMVLANPIHVCTHVSQAVRVHQQGKVRDKHRHTLFMLVLHTNVHAPEPGCRCKSAARTDIVHTCHALFMPVLHANVHAPEPGCRCKSAARTDTVHTCHALFMSVLHANVHAPEPGGMYTSAGQGTQ